VRFAATVLCWLVATVALAVAIPAGWAQRTLVDADGYAALASWTAHDPALQNAMASLLTTKAIEIGRDNRYQVDEDAVHDVATAYTASSSFPGQFADVNRIAHQWLFTDAAKQNGEGWDIDLAPMLSNTSFEQVLSKYRVAVPSRVTVPVTADTTQTLRPGQLRSLATWGWWVSFGVTMLAGVAALLTVAFAKVRGKAIAALGVSALLCGGLGWAAIEIGRRHIDDGLNRTNGDVRTITDVMVIHGEGSLHHWLNLTLMAGGAGVVLGVLITMFGAWRGRS
jgi:hypothetical protein